MQSLGSECSLLSFIVFPYAHHYFAYSQMGEVAAQSSAMLAPTHPQISPAYYYSPQIDSFCLSQESPLPAADSSSNLQ
jgi:hypothetical protein